jgi:vacuolar protein sorting-associated protein 53
VLVNTADYCQTTALEVRSHRLSQVELTLKCMVHQLEQKIREKINDEYKEKVSLQAECELFVGFVSFVVYGSTVIDLMTFSVISMAIIAQLREIESACDPAFGTMSRTLWTNLNQVSGQSAYTGELVNAVEQVVELVKPLVEQKKYLRNLFDKTCR